MKPIFNRLILATAIILFLYSCKSDNLEEIHPLLYCDTTSTITYENQIKPIFVQSCGTDDNSCHIPGGQQTNLLDYFETKDAAEGGDLLGTILHEPGYPPMPNDGRPFDDCSINTIIAWVNRGTPQ